MANQLHFLLDVLVDHYLPIMDHIAEHVDTLEEEVFQATAWFYVTTRIIHLKRGIAAMRHASMGPQRDAILALTRDEFRSIPADIRPYLRDVYDRLARVSDLLDSFRRRDRGPARAARVHRVEPHERGVSEAPHGHRRSSCRSRWSRATSA